MGWMTFAKLLVQIVIIVIVVGFLVAFGVYLMKELRK